MEVLDELWHGAALTNDKPLHSNTNTRDTQEKGSTNGKQLEKQGA